MIQPPLGVFDEKSMDAIIQAKGLAKTFHIGFFRTKVQALRDATFDVQPNEIFGLIGPNGAGKTTTIKILTGLVKRDKGEGFLMGHPVGSPQARQHLGYLPESPYFYEYLTVSELLSFHGAMYGMGRAARDKRADELIEMVGLKHALGRPLRKFSKGMLQRAGLAQALMHDPKLVILDEPQTGLDPLGRAEITQLILDLKAQGKSVFFSSHILPDVERVCDRVAVMVQGRVVDVGRLDKLLDAKVLEVEMVLEGLGEEHRVFVEQAGLSWKARENGTIMLTGVDPARAREVLEEMVRKGAALRSYNERHEHLEDLFLREVQENNKAP